MNTEKVPYRKIRGSASSIGLMHSKPVTLAELYAAIDTDAEIGDIIRDLIADTAERIGWDSLVDDYYRYWHTACSRYRRLRECQVGYTLDTPTDELIDRLMLSAGLTGWTKTEPSRVVERSFCAQELLQFLNSISESMRVRMRSIMDTNATDVRVTRYVARRLDSIKSAMPTCVAVADTFRDK